MKKFFLLSALISLTSVSSFSQGITWRLSGNNNVGPSDFLGGIYTYSFVVDNLVIDTLKMVRTK